MTRGGIVITGSALKTRFPAPGDEVAYRIAGLGETTVRLEGETPGARGCSCGEELM
jgi:2-keto-4-pentenoate hydratase